MNVKQHYIRQTLTVRTAETGVPNLLAYLCDLRDLETGDESSWEGLCRADTPPTPEQMRPDACEVLGFWCVVEVAMLKALARWGWEGNDDADHWTSHISPTPFTDLFDPLTGERTGGDRVLVRVDYGGHMIFDVEGQPLPVAQRVDGVLWGVNERRYDLAKAEAALRSHPHVADLTFHPGQREGLSFWWTPDVETYRRVWRRCLVDRRSYPSTRFPQAAMELDVLGLREAGAVKERRI